MKINSSKINVNTEKKKEITGKAAKAEEKEWTVLFYLDGNNDIEGDVLDSFLTTEEVSDVKNMNLLAELGRAPQIIAHPPDPYGGDFIGMPGPEMDPMMGGFPGKPSPFAMREMKGPKPGRTDDVDGDWSGVRRYYLVPGEKDPYDTHCWINIGEHNKKIDSPVIQDLKNVDMSEPASLSDFIKWGIKNYPAKHYMVVLTNHGQGFMGAMGDYKSKQSMSLKGIEEALKDARKDTGVKPDILVMDDCLMGEVEVAHQLKYEADYYVASESIIHSCFPFQKILNHVKEENEKGSELKPEAFARIIVKDSEENVSDIHSMIAMDLKSTEIIKEGVKILAESLIATDTPVEVIRDIFEETQHGTHDARDYKPYKDYRDIKHMAYLLSKDERIKDEAVKRRAGELYSLLDEKKGIIEEFHDKSHCEDKESDSLSGLSIYLPTDGYKNRKATYPDYLDPDKIENTYKNTDFAKETAWDKVLDKFFKPS